jgi:predicted MFS family arabinose efflux permease
LIKIKVNKSNTDQPLYNINFIVISLCHLLFGLSFFPYLLYPLYIKKYKGTESDIGMLIGIAALSGILIKPVIGRYLDRFGRKKCLIAGGIINIIACIGYFLAIPPNISSYAVRIFHGFASGVIFASFFTYAADIIPASRRSEGIAMFGISGMLGAAAAPPIAEKLMNAYGFHAVFSLMLFSGIALLCVMLFVKEENFIKSKTDFFKAIAQRDLYSTWFITFIFGLGMSCYFTFMATFGKFKGLENVSTFFIFYSLTAVVIRIFFGKLPDKYGNYKILFPSSAIWLIGIFLLFFADSEIWMGLCGILTGTGHGYIFPILSSITIGKTDVRRRGSVMSFFTALIDFGFLLGPIIFGFVIEYYGYGVLFPVVGMTCFFGCSLFFLAKRNKLKQITF